MRASLRAHRPHWSAGQCPHPDSAPLRSLWQHEVGTDWWSASSKNKTVPVTTGCMLPGLRFESEWEMIVLQENHAEWLRWLNHYRFCLGSPKKRERNETARGERRGENVTLMKAGATRIVGHVRCTRRIDGDINDEEGSKKESPGDSEPKTDRDTEQQSVTLSLRHLSC